MTALVHCSDLSKQYRSLLGLGDLLRLRFKRETVRALEGVSFQLGAGEFLGLVGRNGSGKSSLLRVASGLLEPNGGALTVLGQAPYHDAGPFGPPGGGVRRRIGSVLSENRSFFWRLSGRENLRFFAELYGLGRRERDRRVEEMLGTVGLADAAHRRFMEYSTGMRQRLAVARALLTDPDLLLLDEVGQGLDPAFNTFLLELLATRTRERGTGVIFATHHLEELQDRADRVLALVKGRVVYLGATAGFDPSVLEAGTPDGATP